MEFAFALPDRADTDGGAGYHYATSMAQALQAAGHRAAVTEGRWSCAPDAIPVVDGLLLPELLSQIDRLAALGGVALIHHAFARAGRDAESRAAVSDALHAMLPRLHVVATSQPVADRLMADFSLPAVAVVTPGVDDLPRSLPGEAPCAILTLGVLTPRKGHDLLLRALERLTDLDWTLTIAGAAGRDPVHAAHLAALNAELGLENRVRLLPDPTDAEVTALWDGAQLFALATRWEGYPTTVAQALRRGIPVVVTQRAGSGVADLVPPGAGAVCAFDDGPTLSKCLRRMLFDTPLRAEMADGAWQAGQALPGWPAQAARLIQSVGG